jgi:hypothetical protein
MEQMGVEQMEQASLISAFPLQWHRVMLFACAAMAMVMVQQYKCGQQWD